MSNRARQIQDFLAAYHGMSGLVTDTARDIELAKINRSKPEETQAFSESDAKALHDAGNSGQYDIGTKTNADGTFAGYTVAPKAEPTNAATIAAKGMTNFLGKQHEGTLTPDQVMRQRQEAIAGTLMKYDPERGMQMQRQLTQDTRMAKMGERDDQRFAWEKDEQLRRMGAQAKADEQSGRLEAVNKAVAERAAQFMKNPDGTDRKLSVDDQMELSYMKAGELMRAGALPQAEEALNTYKAQALIKVQMETKDREAAAGQAASAAVGGNFAPLIDYYNRFFPDGGKVTGSRVEKDGKIVFERVAHNGVRLAPIGFKNVGEIGAAMEALKNPRTLWEMSQSQFEDDLKRQASARADRKEEREVAQDKREAAMHGVRIAQARSGGGGGSGGGTGLRDAKFDSGLTRDLLKEVAADEKAAQDELLTLQRDLSFMNESKTPGSPAAQKLAALNERLQRARSEREELRDELKSFRRGGGQASAQKPPPSPSDPALLANPKDGDAYTVVVEGPDKGKIATYHAATKKWVVR